jgi:hypothetical protein
LACDGILKKLNFFGTDVIAVAAATGNAVFAAVAYKYGCTAQWSETHF